MSLILQREQELLDAVIDQEYIKVEDLLKAGVNPDSTNRGWTALYSAAGKNCTGIVKLLLDYGADPDKFSHDASPIFGAMRDNFESFKLLTDHSKNINTKSKFSGYTYLYEVFWNGDPQEIEYLILNRGANPRYRNNDGQNVFDMVYQWQDHIKWFAVNHDITIRTFFKVVPQADSKYISRLTELLGAKYPGPEVLYYIVSEAEEYFFTDSKDYHWVR